MGWRGGVGGETLCGGGVSDVEFGVCFKIAASYYDELRAKYHAAQVRHQLAPPMKGAWYILLYQDHLYVDDHEHPGPTRVRKRTHELGLTRGEPAAA